MIKRASIFGVVIAFMATMLLPVNAAAATASVFVSPGSSSVEKGKNITVQVRVNSGTDGMDSAQARLTFDSSRLSYVSHSGGNFTTFQQTVGSNYLDYVGLATGGTSGNRLLFSITFKAQNTGAASLSLSGVRVASSGSDLSISSSGGSISVTAPPPTESPSSNTIKPPSSSTTTTKPPPQSPTNNTTPTSPTENEDVVEPPAFEGRPKTEVSKSTITIRSESDKDSRLRVSYGLDDEQKRTVESDEYSTKQEVTVGTDEPLFAGRQYKLEVTLFDEEGNTSEAVSLEVKTNGVVYKVKILDKQGLPLANYPVELFSDPIAGTTDENGVAVFEDVTPGEHTLVFEIDGITIRQPVFVAESLVLADADGDIAEVAMPFSIADASSVPVARAIRWDIALYAGILGALVATILQHGPSRRFFLKQTSHIKKLRLAPKLHIHPELRPKNIDKTK